jgi:beta-glucanase (GH16 family)
MINSQIKSSFTSALSLMALCFVSLGQSACTDKEPKIPVTKVTPISDKGWTFDTVAVWSDEFTGTGKPDPAKWGYDLGAGGWGNNELEYYTDGANADVSNGTLKITAKKETFSGAGYTSTRMVTKGKGDFLYGRFVARMKLPKGKGTWPAFWMLPTDFAYGDWPKSGEIDIMEHVGFEPNVVHISTHCAAYYFKIGNQKSSKLLVPTATSDFHDYRVDWTPYAVRGFIDGVQIFEFTNQGTGSNAWPFDKRFHMLLNIAVGGDWGGAQGIDATAFPSTMEVDYVRVYKMIEK